MALIVKFALDIKTMKNAVEMGNARDQERGKAAVSVCAIKVTSEICVSSVAMDIIHHTKTIATTCALLATKGVKTFVLKLDPRVA